MTDRSQDDAAQLNMTGVQITQEPMPYGSVLVVDDVETNIYVAKGLMTPYGLKIDSAGDGSSAIKKIKSGNEYDVVFMDHMMPGMDGVETTREIRSLGYAGPVVALTANAVSGQAEMFLENGFDDILPKPIDERLLDNILNKFIRDRRKTETVPDARRQAEIKNIPAGDVSPKLSADPALAEIFPRDAEKAIDAFEKVMSEGDAFGEDELRRYVINMHGIKSALANIGSVALSADALRLEQSGRGRDIGALRAGTPGFVKSLRDLIIKIAGEEKTGGDAAGEANINFLREKLTGICNACSNYDEAVAGEILSRLREMKWPKQVRELLAKLAELLLHSEFEEIISAAEKYLRGE